MIKWEHVTSKKIKAHARITDRNGKSYIACRNPRALVVSWNCTVDRIEDIPNGNPCLKCLAAVRNYIPD